MNGLTHLFLRPEIANPQDLTLLSVKLAQLWVTLSSSAESLSSFFSQTLSLRKSLEQWQPESGEVSSLISSSIPPGNLSIAPGLLGAVSLPSPCWGQVSF